MQSNTAKFIVGLAIVSCAIFYYYFLSPIFSFANLQAQKNTLRVLVEKHYAIAVFLYCATYILITALSLPAAALLTLTGGFLFGIIPGTLYAVLSATMGACLAFILARYLFRQPLMQSYNEKISSFNKEMERGGFWYLLSLRFLAIVPFFLINLLAGLTTISLSVFVSATALGIIPGALAYAYAGHQLNTIQSMRDIVSPGMIAAFSFLAILALIPPLYKRLRS